MLAHAHGEHDDVGIVCESRFTNHTFESTQGRKYPSLWRTVYDRAPFGGRAFSKRRPYVIHGTVCQSMFERSHTSSDVIPDHFILVQRSTTTTKKEEAGQKVDSPTKCYTVTQ